MVRVGAGDDDDDDGVAAAEASTWTTIRSCCQPPNGVVSRLWSTSSGVYLQAKKFPHNINKCIYICTIFRVLKLDDSSEGLLAIETEGEEGESKLCESPVTIHAYRAIVRISLTDRPAEEEEESVAQESQIVPSTLISVREPPPIRIIDYLYNPRPIRWTVYVSSGRFNVSLLPPPENGI